ncbi:MAG: CRISPR-associated protein Cas4 [Nitrospiraceae bacterium]|nr:CRISPR-associated protein Cas4 [Nitrospiraceae bacterium]
MNNDTVFVSEITTYLRCPRLVYFRNRHQDERKNINVKYLSHLILKEIALTYHHALASDDVAETLRTELDRITNELPVLYRVELCDVDRSMILSVASGIDIGAIGSYIAESIRRTGKEELRQKITPCAVEYAMYSDALGIAGSPDKLIRVNDCVIPCIIKTGNKPDCGVWKPDRLQIAAYAMLVEETFGQVVEYGIVEYARFFEIREVAIRHRDRRRVLELRNRIRMIRDGRMPDRPRDAPCDLCIYAEDCITQRSLASKFF